VVNKEDMGAAARKTVADLKAAASREGGEDEWSAPILSVSATQGTGIARLVETLDAHHAWLAERKLVEVRRHQFQIEWVIKRLQQEFGSTGVELLRDGKPDYDHLIRPGDSAFEQYESLRQQLAARWDVA
jgi:LAO/AO transport system kinase